ncbi:hypothetical protein R1sor_022010 [Riccia sorocarpa]|uniref:PHD-type zinc finger plants domain-containing protein n=1 Tax=Riccia sorocarpa TaxID=122646 RepID=A0ABD3GPG6_9MARC
MMGRKGKEEQVFLLFDYKYQEKLDGSVDSRQECSMCGDVGFPEHLRQCTRCVFRFQHTYCCNSAEGLGTGTGDWVCSWCQLEKETVRQDQRNSQEPPETENSVPFTESSISGHTTGTGALEFLLQAALDDSELDPYAAADGGRCGGQSTSSSVDGGSICSSSARTVQGELPGRKAAAGGQLAMGDVSRQGHNRKRVKSGGEEEATTATAAPTTTTGSTDQSNSRSGACDPRKTRRTAARTMANASSKTLQQQKQRKHRSQVELQQCASTTVQLKRQPSLNKRGGKLKSRACNPSKGFVRHYKFLSDISC